MNKKYTKRQIREAISYWIRQLHLMNEAINNLIDALIEEFGEDTVKSSEFSFKITKNNIEKIYDILNFYLFDNELGKIRLECWPEALIVDKLNENSINSGVLEKKYDSAPCYGVYSGVCKDIINETGDIIDIDISNELIMMNKTYLKDCIFIFAVASLCHEMIHYYDRFSAEFHDKQLEQSKTQMEFDCHKDRIFQEMMEKAISNGINVKETLDNTPFKIANKNARYVLKNVIGEDSINSNQSHIVIDRHRITMRGPGSHTFTFAEFD